MFYRFTSDALTGGGRLTAAEPRPTADTMFDLTAVVGLAFVVISGTRRGSGFALGLAGCW